MTSEPQRHVPVLSQSSEPTTTATLARRLAYMALFLIPVLLGLALIFGWFNSNREPQPRGPLGQPNNNHQQPFSKTSDTASDAKPTPPKVTQITAVTPPTPWQTIDDTKPLTRIGVGSCLSQKQPQPIWRDVVSLKKRPELFLMIGDNVYGDIKSADQAELISAYKTQGRHPEFASARTAMPFLATWDDHDYGANDAGEDFTHKEAAAELFEEFWQIDALRERREGIYYARMIGPPGKRVQIVMLDTRTFRSPLTRKTKNLPYWGNYEPDSNPERTILGAQQWNWFSRELERPAQLRIIVSSIQVFADGHGFERWGNFPHERTKFKTVIELAPPVPTIVVSGDRHFSALYQSDLANGRVLPELTTSSLNRSYGPSNDRVGPELISGMYHKENFALVDIDWDRDRLALSLHGLGGTNFHVAKFSFSKLALGATSNRVDAQ